MARAIPTYQRQVIATGVQQAPNATSVVREQGNPAAQGLQDLIAGAASGAQSVAAVDQKKTDDRDAVQVANTLSEGQVFWQEDFTRRSQAWKPGDEDMRAGIGKDFDEWVSKSESALATEGGKKYFREHALQMKTRMQLGAFDAQEKTITNKLNVDTDIGVQADMNVAYNDPSQVPEVYNRRAETIIARTDLSPAEKTKQLNDLQTGMYEASERGQVERDPLGWYRARYGEPGAQESAGAAPGTGGGTTGAVQATPGTYTATAQNIARAIYGQESGHGKADTSHVNSQDVTGPMQVQQATFNGMKRLGIIPQTSDWKNPADNKAAGDAWVGYLTNKYNGDAAKVAAAYYGGEKAVRADGTIRRSMGNKSRPSDPTVGEYVDQVLKRMGGQSASGAGEGTGPSPVPGAPASFSGLDWQKQSALRRMAETKIAQGEAVYKAQTTQTVGNLTAMHKDGVVEAVPLAPDVFNRAYGVSGPAAYEQYRKSRDMGAQIGGFKTESNAEIQASVEASRPTADTPDYAAADSRFRVTAQAAAQVMKMRNADPVGYAASNNSDLAAQQAVLADENTPVEQRPALRQKYITDNMAEQTRLGISQPKILTPGQVDSIAMQAMTATRPEDSANLISGLEAEYGDHFPQMFGELVSQGKINGELLIIPNLDSASTRSLVSQLARVKEADLTQGIEAADQKTVKEAAVDSASLLAKTFPRAMQQGAETLNAYAGMTRKIAYQLMANGVDANKAAQQANEMLLGKYDIQDTIRFPLSVDQSAVYRGIDSKMNLDQDSFDLPEDASRGRDEEALTSEWQNTVRARGKWYTNDDDNGVELWAAGANGLPHKVTINGSPVSYTFDELAAENEAALATPENPVRAAFGVYGRRSTTEE